MWHEAVRQMRAAGLNAPFGARCFLTAKAKKKIIDAAWSLNAPFGARCFLTGLHAFGGDHDVAPS